MFWDTSGILEKPVCLYEVYVHLYNITTGTCNIGKGFMYLFSIDRGTRKVNILNFTFQQHVSIRHTVLGFFLSDRNPGFGWAKFYSPQ